MELSASNSRYAEKAAKRFQVRQILLAEIQVRIGSRRTRYRALGIKIAASVVDNVAPSLDSLTFE
jgi:hypothetical protein